MPLRLQVVFMAAIISGVAAFGIITVVLVSAEWGYPLHDIAPGLAGICLFALVAFCMMATIMTLTQDNNDANTLQDVDDHALSDRATTYLSPLPWSISRATQSLDAGRDYRDVQLLAAVVQCCRADRRDTASRRCDRPSDPLADAGRLAVHPDESGAIQHHDSAD